MTTWQRLVSAIGGRGIVVVIGGLFVAIGIAWAPLETSRGTPTSTALLLSLFIVCPGVVLAFSGYRLSDVDVDPEFHPALVSRCVGGGAMMMGLVAIYHFNPAGGMGRPFRLLLILGAFGSVAGFRIGLHHARASELRRTRDQLAETVDQLETSNELLEQFAYAASHDLQEPLRMVSSHLLLVERRSGDALDAESREYLEYTIDCADRMRGMIDGLLEYARIESSDEPFEPVDLESVVEEVRTDLQLPIDESGAEVDVEALPRVRGDPGQLHQVFQNVLKNAIDYSGDAPPRIHVSAERNGTEWTVSVRDEGIGIEPDETDRVFEVFERLRMDDAHDGTGIGLTLCKRIVERHGGEIWVDSKPGEGATVSFTLPVVEGETRG